MNEPTNYQIVIRGHATDRLLGHLSDDFEIDHPLAETTQLTGVIRDAAHLHGVLAYLTSLAVEIVSVTPTALQRLSSRSIQPSNERHTK